MDASGNKEKFSQLISALNKTGLRPSRFARLPPLCLSLYTVIFALTLRCHLMGTADSDTDTAGTVVASRFDFCCQHRCGIATTIVAPLDLDAVW